MRVELTAKDRDFLRVHLNKLHAEHAAVVARAAHWKRVAFMWCSGAILLSGGIILTAIFRAAQW